ncbi:MAG: PilT/PilU family type 4a pilus ATPase [Deltaproteobacteria bacterium]|nr:PilT/PilU family type 4a pilus ATPase [Deltaproteobacteria bacterium]MBW2120554.1 PilT/PilU family type 4a pilus ATPase [Deltaproteobacteria bacterium]
MSQGKQTSDAGRELIEKVLAGAYKYPVSDIHFKVGEPPFYRIFGELKRLGSTPLSLGDLHTIAKTLRSDFDEIHRQNNWKQFDCSVAPQNLGRFRVSFFKQKNTPAIVLRVIPKEVPSFTQLRLPLVIKRIAGFERGLLLVTGATGMGKSTTIASILDFINKNWCKHILTIEDPIEFVIESDKSSISQREVGRDVEDYHSGLWAAMRQDPDIIFIGEIRNSQTMDVAIQAAETGHFVLSTVHTPDVTRTISRVIGLFPSEEQHMIRSRFAENLKAIVSQNLLPRQDHSGRVLATEILVNNYSIQECIRDPDSTPQDLLRHIENGMDEYQMQTFEYDLVSLLREGLITLDVAKTASRSPSDFVKGLDLTR